MENWKISRKSQAFPSGGGITTLDSSGLFQLCMYCNAIPNLQVQFTIKWLVELTQYSKSSLKQMDQVNLYLKVKTGLFY